MATAERLRHLAPEYRTPERPPQATIRPRGTHGVEFPQLCELRIAGEPQGPLTARQPRGVPSLRWNPPGGSFHPLSEDGPNRASKAGCRGRRLQAPTAAPHGAVGGRQVARRRNRAGVGQGGGGWRVAEGALVVDKHLIKVAFSPAQVFPSEPQRWPGLAGTGTASGAPGGALHSGRTSSRWRERAGSTRVSGLPLPATCPSRFSESSAYSCANFTESTGWILFSARRVAS